jgi:long-chain acyl-CoA synthetase
VKITPDREILVRSAGLFKEYYHDPAATAQALTADGWFHTGDAGYVGDDGQLHIVDRLKDIGTLRSGTALTPKLIENKLKFSPYIREAVVFGNQRSMVCALIDIDVPSTGNWLDRQGVSYTGHADLATRDEVASLIAEAVAQVNAELVRDPALARLQIRRFLILPKELGAGDGVLTHMRKLRRDVVADRYGALIDALYDGRAGIGFDTEVFHEDGSASAVPMEIHIHDATSFGLEHARPRRLRKAA